MLDRDQPDKLGGLARESMGGMFAVDTPEQRRAGARDSVALALADWHAFAEFAPDDHWPRRWAQAYMTHCTQQMYWWLRGKGVKYFPVPHWVERIGPLPLVTGFDTRDLVTQICRQPGGYSWQVLNHKIALKELAVSGSSHNPSIRDQKWAAFVRDLLFGNR
jgi:predicted oxidoreductase